MDALSHQIRVRRSARYYTLGPDDCSAERLLYVLHGYGQLAQYFIEHFKSIADSKTLVVAPEGLSRFYVDGLNGRVGASWMTSEARTEEVDDYLSYLDSVHASVLENSCSTPQAIDVLGFSQGTATASRWLATSHIQVNNLVLWSGAVAHDIDLSKLKVRRANLHIWVVFGTSDLYLKSDEVAAQVSDLRTAGFEPEYDSFDGGHQIDQTTLQEVNRKLIVG